MQVILTKDTQSLGRKGQAVKVKPGYFRNFLLPKGLASASTKKSLIRAEEVNKRIQEEIATLKKAAEKLRDTLRDTVLHIKEKLTKKGTLYSKVSKKELAEALTKETGVKFEAAQVVLAEAIKNVGTFEFDVKLGSGVAARVKVAIEGVEE